MEVVCKCPRRKYRILGEKATAARVLVMGRR